MDMIKKDVILSVRGQQRLRETEDNEAVQEPVELVTEGVLEQTENGWLLRYEESQLTGMEGTTTQFSLDGDTVTLTRRGSVCSHMTFRLGQQDRSVYETPFGAMTIETYTTRLQSTIGPQGGMLHIRYSIAVEHQITGENQFFIEVREKSSEGEQSQ